MHKILTAAALTLATLLAQAQPAPLKVEGAWTRATVPGQSGTGAFMTLTASEPLSLVGVSMAGAVAHNLAQVCVAVLITGEVNLFYYAFVLIAVGAVSGSITGIVAGATFGRAAGALRIKEQAPHILQSNQGGAR